MHCVSVFYKSRPGVTNAGNREGCRPVLRRRKERARLVKGKGNPVLSKGGRDPVLRRGREVRRLERGGCQNQKEKERAPRTEYWKRTGVSVTLAVPSLPEAEEADDVEVMLTKLLVRR